MRPAARVTAGIFGSALILLIVMVIQGPALHAPAEATEQKARAVAGTPGPAAVVREIFTAINRQDWPTLWNLWKHPNPRRGHAYRQMIAGYRPTARDVITNLNVEGDIVSARVLAYETTGTIQTYKFRYKVHAGTIAWGHSVLLATSHSGVKGPSVLAQPPNLTANSVR